MKRIKRFVCVLLACLFGATCLSLFAACGGGASKEDEYTADGKLIIELFGIDLDSIATPTTESRRILNIVEERFGIHFDVTSSTQGTWSQVLNASIGRGDSPDLFFHLRRDPSYSDWLEWDLMMDFEPYLDDYPNLKAVFDSFDPNLKTLLGGSYFGYPVLLKEDYENVSQTINHAMFYRRDWYEHLVDTFVFPDDYEGYNGAGKAVRGQTVKDPESEGFTYLDWYNLMWAYTYGDPDGNGRDDTIGYGLNMDAAEYWWYPILSMFGVFSGNWEWTGTQWEPQVYADAMKDALMFMTDLYDNGMIPSGYATSITQETEKNNFVAGRYGAMTFNSGTNGLGVYTLLDTTANRNNYESLTGEEYTGVEDIVRGMPAVVGTTGQRYVKGDYNNYGYFSIDDNCSEAKKEKILELMNWLLSDEGSQLMDYGIEGTHWEWEGDQRVSLIETDADGYPKPLWNQDIAPAAAKIKALVCWEQNVLPASKYYEERLRLNAAWNNSETDFLMDPLHFVSVGPEYGTTISMLEDLVSTTYTTIVGDRYRIDGQPGWNTNRENAWNQFVARYKQEGGDYINAMNAAADAAGIAHD